MTLTLKDFRFGIEIETIGLTHARLAQAIVDACPNSRLSSHTNYGQKVYLADGRVWSVVHDGSLSGQYNGEVVSPILTYADLDMLQNVVRGLREAGAKTDASCGIHIHVDGARFTPRGVVNLVKMMNKQEQLLMSALRVHETRRRFCQDIDQNFLARLENSRCSTLDAVKTAWYGRRNANVQRYDSSRYRSLNLNSLFYRGTIEFRLFNGTLHAGEVKSYVQLVLAMSAKAVNAKSGVSKKRETSAATGKYDMRVFLLGLGLIGDEFKTARHHLCKHLGGSSAFRNTRPRRSAQCVDIESSAAPLISAASIAAIEEIGARIRESSASIDTAIINSAYDDPAPIGMVPLREFLASQSYRLAVEELSESAHRTIGNSIRAVIGVDAGRELRNVGDFVIDPATGNLVYGGIR